MNKLYYDTTYFLTFFKSFSKRGDKNTTKYGLGGIYVTSSIVYKRALEQAPKDWGQIHF